MSLSEAIQKVFDFLSEYRQESATLPVSEQQMDTFEEMFSGREVKSSRIKQRCILVHQKLIIQNCFRDC